MAWPGYVGDQYPLCVDLPQRAFLKINAKFRLLGGSTRPQSHQDPNEWEGDEEVARLTLRPESDLFKKLCNPRNPSAPDTTLGLGSGAASFSALYKAPFCSGSNRQCDSNNLLRGRVTETNRPNTIDDCLGGTSTDTNYDNESVRRILVQSTSGEALRGGELARIHTDISAFSMDDRVDFYYAADASDPHWVLITIVAPPTGDSSPLTVPYNKSPDVIFLLPKCTSPSGCKQAVRVALRSGRDPDKTSSSKARSDGNHKPESDCASELFDDVDDLVFDVLPSFRPQDMCNFQTIVTLDENLECNGQECLVDTVRVVQVTQGVFYEYLHNPCVHFLVYDDPVKVFSGAAPSKKWSATMCANKKLPSALPTCCGPLSSDRKPNGAFFSEWADVLSEYRYERITYGGNEARCSDWGERYGKLFLFLQTKYDARVCSHIKYPCTVCDPKRIGPYSMW